LGSWYKPKRWPAPQPAFSIPVPRDPPGHPLFFPESQSRQPRPSKNSRHPPISRPQHPSPPMSSSAPRGWASFRSCPPASVEGRSTRTKRISPSSARIFITASDTADPAQNGRSTLCLVGIFNEND